MKMTLLKIAESFAFSKGGNSQTFKKWSKRPISIINFYSPLIIFL